MRIYLIIMTFNLIVMTFKFWLCISYKLKLLYMTCKSIFLSIVLTLNLINMILKCIKIHNIVWKSIYDYKLYLRITIWQISSLLWQKQASIRRVKRVKTKKHSALWGCIYYTNIFWISQTHTLTNTCT